jgi:glycosyltransferase involved in cell wall biosynthesis
MIVPGFPASDDDWFTPAVTDTIMAMKLLHEVTVITLSYPGLSAEYTVNGTTVLSLGRLRPVSLVRLLKRIYRLHRSKPLDLIHAFWATRPGVAGTLLSRIFRIPLVVTCAGGELVERRDIGYGDWRAILSRGYVRTSFLFASRIVVGSEFQRRLVLVKFPRRAEETLKIPLGIDTRIFVPPHKSDDDGTIRILHVASLVPIKNQRLLLDALALLTDLDWHLDIVGDGLEKDHLKLTSDALGIASRIRWHGWVHHSSMPELYQQSDIFVLTSEHEAQGMVVLEAMASGLPVVATAVGIAEELINTCVPTGDYMAFAEQIAHLAENRSIRLATGLLNRNKALRFDRSNLVQDLADLYGNVIGEKLQREGR